MEDDLELLLVERRCKCCRRPLQAKAIYDYCRRKVCIRERLKHEVAWRDMIHAKNNRWHKRKAESDPEWADRRREATRIRIASQRAKKKPAQNEEVSDV